MGKIIETAEDVLMIISKYEWLVKQADRLTYQGRISEVETVTFTDDNKMLIIGGDDNDYESVGYAYEKVPIEWLFLSDGELAEAKTQRIKEEKQEEERLKAERIQREKEKQEQKDREEYERLKAKFEGNR